MDNIKRKRPLCGRVSLLIWRAAHRAQCATSAHLCVQNTACRIWKMGKNTAKKIIPQNFVFFIFLTANFLRCLLLYNFWLHPKNMTASKWSSSTITYILNLNKIGLFQNYLFTSTLQKSQQKYFTALASKVSQIWKKIIILIRDYLILGGKLGKYGWVFRRIEPMNNCFLVFLAFSEDFFQLIPFSTLLVSGGLASLCLCLSLFFVRVYSQLQHILRMWSSQLQYD